MSKIKIEIEEDQFGNVAMLQKLPSGEPFFVIRGQDKLGAAAVEVLGE